MVKLIDTHAHISLIEESEEEVYNLAVKSFSSGIDFIVNVALDHSSYIKARNLYKKEKRAICTCGIYPSYAPVYNKDMYSRLISDIEEGYALAIGECGLDYYRNYGTKDQQIRLFEDQIKLAIEYSLPLIVHARDSYEDIYKVLKRNSPLPARGVIHCYGGDTAFAKKFIDIGFFISFAGNLTYKNANLIKESAIFTPLDSILVETDSPYLAPVPYRGKKNYPWHVSHTAEYLARLKGISIEELGTKTTANAIRLFKIKQQSSKRHSLKNIPS